MQQIITGPGQYRDENGDVWEFDMSVAGEIRMTREGRRFVAWYLSDGMPAEGFKDFPRILSRIDPEPSVDPNPVDINPTPEPWKRGDECEFDTNASGTICAVVNEYAVIDTHKPGIPRTIPLHNLRRPVKRRVWTVRTTDATNGAAILLTCDSYLTMDEANELHPALLAALNSSEVAK